MKGPTIAIPNGQLVFADSSEPVAYLSASRPARKAMREWFDRLASTYSASILIPRRLADGPKGFEIHYPEEPLGTVGLPEKIAQWGQDVPASVPFILGLGRFALEISNELAGRGLGDALVAPALIRFIPGSTEPYRLLPLPCGTTGLADWSTSDPEIWQWLSADGVLGGFKVDPVRSLGAALHQALVGSLFPDSLSGRDKFLRVLRGRAGLRARLNVSAVAALPKTFGPDAAELEKLVFDCLQPPTGPRPDAAQAKTRFNDLSKRLSTDRLIRYWGFENRPATAAALAEIDKIPERIPDSPPQGAKDWSDVADDQIKSGDLAGALESAWKAVMTDGPFRARLYLSIVQRIASRFPFPVAEANAAIGRIARQFGDKLEEADALRLVHLKLRYLNEPDFQPNLLNRRYESTWNEATARLMQAWLLLRQGTNYNQTSKLCKEARKLYEAMPERGGESGLYATAYLHLLDGIAHIGAVSTYGNESFYTDAFEQFSLALELATSISAEDEIRASFHWLGWLARFTKLYPGPPLSLVYAGIEAILRSQGLTAETYASVGVPEIPRYADDKIFPL